MTGYRLNRKIIFKTLQIVLGLAALGWVITQPNWSAIRSGVSMLSTTTVVAIIILTFFGIIAKFTMWTALIGKNFSTSLLAAGRTELSVNFVNQLLPSRLSGRVAAPLIVRQNTGIDWNSAVAVTIAHTGLFALLYGTVSLAGLVAGATRFPYGITVLILLSTGLYLTAGVAILTTAVKLDGLTDWLDTTGIPSRISRVRSLVVNRVLDFPFEIAGVAPLVRSLLADPRVVISYSIGWGIALVVVPGIRLWLLFEGMQAPFTPVWVLPLFAVAAYSVTLLPLTPGGIGVTEATATLVFIAVGVPSAVIVPAVLIDRFVGVYLPALCGWYPTMSIGLDELRRENE